jgi:hypothetical protein
MHIFILGRKSLSIFSDVAGALIEGGVYSDIHVLPEGFLYKTALFIYCMQM